jgi:hypothetical protein
VELRVADVLADDRQRIQQACGQRVQFVGASRDRERELAQAGALEGREVGGDRRRAERRGQERLDERRARVVRAVRQEFVVIDPSVGVLDVHAELHGHLLVRRASLPCRNGGHDGLEVHGGNRVAQDVECFAQARLERPCRYLLRPALASERLELLPDGRVKHALRHAWRDGTTAVVMEPLEFLERLAALPHSPPLSAPFATRHGPGSRVTIHRAPATHLREPAAGSETG